MGGLPIHRHLETIRDDANLADLVDYLNGRQKQLANFFSFELATDKADPKKKPIVIRGNQDEWTLDGPDEKYVSLVSAYLAEFIRHADVGGIDIPDKRTWFGRNLRVIDNYLDALVSAHKQKETKIHYPDALTILDGVSEELIWEYERPDLVNVVRGEPSASQKHEHVAVGIQFCVLLHYLFERACLSMIVPSSDDWAFDIFQSLNATGTPLTAIETFKPLVVNSVKNFKGTKSDEYFARVDGLFLASDTVEKKAKLTKEFLNVFSLMSDGRSLSSHFSAQRKWLNSRYTKLGADSEREEFIHRLADTADYWINVKSFDHQLNCYHGLGSLSSEDKQTALLCVAYLDESGHRMADTVLGRFYALVLRGAPQAADSFLDVAKTLCAFFTLWRSVASNAGLDEVYRRLLNPRSDPGRPKDPGIPDLGWGDIVSAADVPRLRSYLRGVLESEKGVVDRDGWISRAKSNLKYDSAKTVCKLALLISAHDTIGDPDSPGLVKPGKPGVSPCLDHASWISAELKSIEHIAPQKDSSGSWDQAIYSGQLEHSVGNLALLPTVVNSSAGNRSWEEKLLYYRHLAETDSAKLDQLKSEALNKGIVLSEETLELLVAAKHSVQVKPIVEFASADPGADWSPTAIESRAERISELVWDRLWPWLS